MAKTLDEAFRQFLAKLTPTGTETDAAKRHRASIDQCIRANLGLEQFFRTGSFGNGTSVSGHSDVDYFAVIPRDNLHGNSNVDLWKLREILDTRFPNTGVHTDAPAVVVPFGTDASESTEVVIADDLEFKTANGLTRYHIPDGAGGWMTSSPEAHKSYVRKHDDRLSGKVKPLIRFVKAWKYYREVPIKSFYVELFTTYYASSESVIVYDIDLKNLFVRMHEANLQAMDDPVGVAGMVPDGKELLLPPAGGGRDRERDDGRGARGRWRGDGRFSHADFGIWGVEYRPSKLVDGGDDA